MRFTIRDLLWLMVVAALGVALICEHRGRRESERQYGEALGVIRILKNTIQASN